MRTFVLPLAILASSAAAQTTTACGADYIVEACLSTQRAKLNSCGTEDYSCRCNAWKDILICYDNCPNDERRKEDDGQRQIFCGYASQFASTTTTPPPASTTTSAPAEPSDDQDPTTTISESSTATSSESGPTSTNSGAGLVLNAGGVLAAVAGAVAVVL
ncbi:hypothetical protein VTH06DRAFT_7310 [Thermothelomyces fergusii]